MRDPPSPKSVSRDEGARAAVDIETSQAALAAALGELADARAERDTVVEAHRLSQRRERTLADALHHRLRNTLALIRSIIRRTLEAGTSQQDFAEHLEGRIAAIARYQRSTSDGSPCPVDLENMVRDALLPSLRLDRPGCTLSGPAVFIEGEALVPMALAFHELVTNMLKFGALPEDGGTLAVTWSVSDEPGARRLRLRWTETGPALPSPPTDVRGFGREYLEDGLPYQLDAVTSFDVRANGLVCTIDVPLRSA